MKRTKPWAAAMFPAIWISHTDPASSGSFQSGRPGRCLCWNLSAPMSTFDQDRHRKYRLAPNGKRGIGVLSVRSPYRFGHRDPVFQTGNFRCWLDRYVLKNYFRVEISILDPAHPFPSQKELGEIMKHYGIYGEARYFDTVPRSYTE